MYKNIEDTSKKINQELLYWTEKNYIDRYIISDNDFEDVLYHSIIEGSPSQYEKFLMVFIPYWKLWDCNKWDMFLAKIAHKSDFHVIQLLIFICKYLDERYLQRFIDYTKVTNKEVALLNITKNISHFKYNERLDSYLIVNYLHNCEALSLAKNVIASSLGEVNEK